LRHAAFGGTRSPGTTHPHSCYRRDASPNGSATGGRRQLEGWQGLPQGRVGGQAPAHSAGLCCLPQAGCAFCWRGKWGWVRDSSHRQGQGCPGRFRRRGVTAVPTALRSLPSSMGTGTVPDPSATSNQAFFCFVFFMSIGKLPPPQLLSQPLCLSHTSTAASPVTESQSAAWQRVVIALPRQDWSTTSWLRWQAAMTTHELNKQQEEQLFKIINNNKKSPTPAKLQPPLALATASTSPVLASCRNRTTAACVLTHLRLPSDRATG